MRKTLFVVMLSVILLVFAACPGGASKVKATPAFSTPASSTTPTPTVNVPCESTEQLTYHVHAHLTIIANNQNVAIPANLGIRTTCIFWLHTHDQSGMIHIETLSQRAFTLGQFFQVSGERLSPTELLNLKTDDTHQIRAFVNGQPFTGDPRDIPLTAHAQIVLEYGPPFPDALPVPFQFPTGQ